MQNITSIFVDYAKLLKNRRVRNPPILECKSRSVVPSAMDEYRVRNPPILECKFTLPAILDSMSFVRNPPILECKYLSKSRDPC